MAALRQRLGREDGWTLLELSLVIMVVAILVAIAVPSYLAHKSRAAQAVAESNVRAALPAVEAFRADCGKYADATATECSDGVARTFDVTGLKTYEPGLQLRTVKSIAGGAGYCVDARVGGMSASFTGPGGTVAATACA